MKTSHKILMIITILVVIVGAIFFVADRKEKKRKLDICVGVAKTKYENTYSYTVEQKELRRKEMLDSIEICKIKY